MKRILLLFLILWFGVAGCAIAASGKISHKQFEHYSLSIYQPAGDVDERFPVMYVMDGQHYFFNGIGFQQSLRHNVHISPQFIVVGINTENLYKQRGQRWRWFGPEADRMISELTNKIVPYIDDHYPSNGNRMYFGWQAAAGFGLELFAKRPDLIQGYFLSSSPTFTAKRIERAKALLNRERAFDHYFYLSLGEEEDYAKEQFESLSALLKRFESRGIRSKYHLSPSYTRQSTPLDVFSHGLSWYFSDYPDFTFFSFEQIQRFGGVEAVEAYYQQRAKRYGLAPDIGEQTRYSMFRHAVEADQWQAFQGFEQKLGQYQVSNDAGQWHYQFFGDFFLKHQAFERAQALFLQGVKNYPTAHQMSAKLAFSKQQLGKREEAIRWYQKASEQATDSPSIKQEYLQQVENLETREK